ncbi:MAG: hypothetical protein AUG49_15030 [Catenulispora sp. 13_1_20CM_3_70_7]|nr:MAG: hypothetical protein AUG49_15030 [Catenulispora sp. 13_1_20CM_3_70_7]
MLGGTGAGTSAGGSPSSPSARLASDARVRTHHSATARRLLDGAGGDDVEGERQAGAQADQLADDVVGGAAPLRPEFLGRQGSDRQPLHPQPLPQQPPGLLLTKRIQRDRHGPVERDQPRQPHPAGDQHQAAGRAGQQRAHLLGVAGVVQQHQHPPGGQVRAVQRRLLVPVQRDLPGRHAERGEESVDGGRRRERRIAGSGATQVHVQLAVGEAVGVPVGPVHGQGRLADTRRAVDGRDHRRTADVGLGGQQCGQGRQLGRPADEVPDRGRQLPGRRCRVGGRHDAR